MDLDDVVNGSWTVLDDRLARWQAGFDDMFALVAGCFAQADSRRRARMYLLGLLSGAEWQNSWTLAEQTGDLTPDGMQFPEQSVGYGERQVPAPGGLGGQEHHIPAAQA